MTPQVKLVGTNLTNSLAAFLAPDCTINSTNSDCKTASFLARARSFLHLLDVSAVLLAILLIVFVVMAVRAYRRNKNLAGPK